MRKLSKILITIGFIFLLCAASLIYMNQKEDKQAEATIGRLMNEMIHEPITTTPDPYDVTMTTKEIEGIDYIGYVSIPALGLELPITSDWSQDLLKISPCRYKGSTKSDDLILCAHNYKSHFGYIGNLQLGDEISFTDMDGQTIHYKVVAKEVLSPTAVEEMESGDYDLTLFTCTYAGENRMTIRCDRIR